MKRLQMANFPYPEEVIPMPPDPGDPVPWLLEAIPMFDLFKLAAIDLEHRLEVEKAQVLISTANKTRVERKLEIYNALLETQAEQAK